MSACPERSVLERLLAEALADPERTQVESHVEQCENCQSTLHELTLGAAGPTSTTSGSASRTPPPQATDPQSEAFFEQLKRMKPPTDAPGNSQSPKIEPIGLVEVEGYEILGELGRGAIGVVYRARHLKLNRLIALKMILAGPQMAPEVRQRFGVEAMTIARLQHPNIVQIYDVGEHARCPFLSLELLDGGNLTDWMDGKPRTPHEAASIIATLARAVQYAHEQGVIHRDLKPANVLLGGAPDRTGKPELKITDFGIAKVLPQPGMAQSEMTQAGDILGTPAYMAPEQARGNAADICPATDVYSLGAMFYELLTGRPPFQGATPIDTLMQAARQDPVPIGLLVPRVPRDLNTICLKCLEKDPSKRYQTAGALADDVGRFLRDEPIRAFPISWAGHLHRWTRRHQALAAALAGVVLLLLLVTAGSLMASAHFRLLERQQQILAQERESERQKAVAAEQSSNEHRLQAEHARDELRQNLYLDQMSLGAAAALSPSGIGRVRDWLAPWATSRPDLRNWEWFYLNGLCHRDLLTLSGHYNQVLDVKWSPDGGRLASCGSDGTIRLWSSSDGRAIRRMNSDVIAVNRIAWSPNGQFIAAANFTGSIKLWNTYTGALVKTIALGNAPIYTVVWSPDSMHLAWGGFDRRVIIGDATTGAIQRVMRGHTDSVFDVAWSRDSQRLASGSADNSIRIWDPTTGKLLQTYHGHVNFVNRIAWSPDGTRLASASNDKTVIIWDTSTGTPVRKLVQGMGVLSVAWSVDSARLATGCDDQTVRTWRTSDGAELSTLRGHTLSVTAVAWSPDGARIASSSNDNKVKIWDGNSSPEVRTLGGNAESIFSVAWSPDGRRLASGSTDWSVKIWDVAAGREQFIFHGNNSHVRSVAWNPEGTRVASAGLDHIVRLWNAIDGSLITSFAASTDEIECLAWSPDGRQLATVGADLTVRTWNAATGKLLHSLLGHTANVISVAWSPDSKCVASTSADGTVRLWDAATGHPIRIIPGNGNINCVAWSADGNRLAAGGYDQTIRIWNAHTGELQATLRGHTSSVMGVAWNRDGTRLASASDDHTAKIWDTSTGREAASFECGSSMVQSVAWSPDGLVLAAGGEDGKIRLFDATVGYTAEMAPQFLPMLNRRIATDPANPVDRMLRAQIEANANDWNSASIDTQKYLAINRAAHWFTLGYWVAGPYSDDLKTSCAPEKSPDPATPAGFAWHHVPFAFGGFLDFGKEFAHADHISGYAMLRVYSPKQQKVAILLGSDDMMRLWLNGVNIHESLSEREALPDDDAVIGTLKAGWNTLLTRVVNVTGEHALYLRLSDAPADMKRAAAGPTPRK